MSETTHQGGCHCGAVRYQVALDLEKPALVCNCSICSKQGTMLSFVPPDKFTLERGTAELTDYQFNKNNLHHLFCKMCGVKSFARGTDDDGQPMVAINVRCLDDVDLDKVPTQFYDGKKL